MASRDINRQTKQQTVTNWVTSNPEKATAVGNGTINASVNLTGQVINNIFDDDSRWWEIDIWDTIVSFGEGYVTGYLSTLFPAKNEHPWADNHGHTVGRIILPFLNFVAYVTGQALTGGPDDEAEFWIGALFAIVPGMRGGGMGPRRMFDRIPLSRVIGELISGAGESVFEEFLQLIRKAILGDDYE